MSPRWTFLAGVLLAAGLYAASPAAHAATCTNSWKDPVDGSWQDPSRWTAEAVPASAHQACIGLPGGYTVTLQGSATVAGLHVSSGPTLRIEGSSGGGNAVLTVNGPVANDGTILITGTGIPAAARLVVPVDAGSIANAGTLRTTAGAGGDRRIDGTVVNTGTMDLGGTARLTQPLSQVTNTGTITAAGVVTLEGVPLAQQAGSLAVTGELRTLNGSLDYTGGTVTGTVHLHNSALHDAGTSPATFSMEGFTSTFSGDVAAGQTLVVQGGVSPLCTGCNAKTTVSGPVTNAGEITLVASSSAALAWLAVPADVTLTNTGPIRTVSGAGGDRRIDANIVSSGTIDLGGTARFTLANSTNTNTGTIAVGGVATVESATLAHQAGALDVTGELRFSSGTLDYTGGTASGTVHLHNSTLHDAGTGGATFSMEGSSSRFSGDVAAGQTLVVQAGNTPLCTGCNAKTVVSGAVTNAGTIVLSSAGSAKQAYLQDALGSPITNTGSIRTLAGAGGDRRIDADIVSDGTMDLSGSLTYMLPGATLTNRGTISVPSGKTLNATGTTIRNEGASITGDGTVALASSATLLGTGTVAPDVTSTASTVAPGLSPGILNLSRTYTQASTSSLNVEIAGNDAGTGYDQLNVSGHASIAGKLAITVAPGFTPPVCRSFRIMNAGSLAGTFGQVVGGDLGGGLALRPVYDANGVTLIVADAGAALGPVVVSPTSVDVAEGGATAPYTLCLSFRPATPVTVTPAPDAQVGVAPGSVTFDGSDYMTPKPVVVTAVDDTAIEGDHTGLIMHTASNAATVPSVTARITDNDSADANRAPDAVDDGATTPQYQAVSIAVLANDRDPDGDAMTVTAVSSPQHGTAAVEPDGRVTYTPDPSFKGSDSFTYTVRDARGLTDTATVTVTEAACGEDGLRALDGTPVEGALSQVIDRTAEPIIASAAPRLAILVHTINCLVVVPAEDSLDEL